MNNYVKQAIDFRDQYYHTQETTGESFIAAYSRDDSAMTIFTKDSKSSQTIGDNNLYFRYHSPNGTMSILNKATALKLPITLEDKIINQLIHVLDQLGQYHELEVYKKALYINLIQNNIKVTSNHIVVIKTIYDESSNRVDYVDLLVGDLAVFLIYDHKSTIRRQLATKRHVFRDSKIKRGLFLCLEIRSDTIINLDVYSEEGGKINIYPLKKTSVLSIRDAAYASDSAGLKVKAVELLLANIMSHVIYNTTVPVLLRIIYDTLTANNYNVKMGDETTECHVKYKDIVLATLNPDFIVNDALAIILIKEPVYVDHSDIFVRRIINNYKLHYPGMQCLAILPEYYLRSTQRMCLRVKI